jgi:hypothetical protein
MMTTLESDNDLGFQATDHHAILADKFLIHIKL